MAVTKTVPIKSTLSKALEYIMNPDKTDGKLLVSSFACGCETADIEFEHTLKQSVYRKGDNLARHLIQSFAPGESTPEQAHEIGRQLADEILQGKYEYVLTTHIDKGHIHNHIMFCAASFVDHHKYVSNRKTYANIRRVSDRLCEEHGLSVVVPGQERGKHYAEYAADKAGGSWKSKLKMMMDVTIPLAKDFEDFLRRMEAAGYEVKRGKYISLRAPGQERFTRAKTLGADYTEEAITGRISGEYVRAARTVRDAGQDTLPAVIEKRIKAQQEAGNPYWMKINNLKEAAKTVNWLTEKGLLYHEDFEAKNIEVAAAFDEATDALKSADSRLTEMAVLIKHIETYQQTKPIADGLKTAKDKDAYRHSHESELILHEAAVRALKKSLPEGEKLPSLVILQAEHAKLTGRRDSLRTEYASLKKQAHDMGVIKRNVDSILGVNTGQSKSKVRAKER
jgi:hypothetical protein